MRALLINPFCPLSESPSPPLGLAFIAAALEAAGVEVRVLDLVTHPYDRQDLGSLLDEFQPQLVGATAVTMTFNAAAEVVRDVKSLAPEVVTVMGGPHVSFCVEETLNALPELDLIVLGEGEATIVDIARHANDGRDWANVRGIAFRNGNEIRRTEHRPPLDIDSLPLPARHLLPLGRYRALNMAISMTTSRGCPFPCIFCVGRKMHGPKVRYRKAHAVVDELQYLSTLGFPQVNIADDLFTAKKSHCLAICDEIIRRGLKVKWSCFARVDTVSTPLLRKMKEAGCATVGFGVESGNAEILKTIRKKITLPKVVDAIEMCNEAGLQAHFSFILGLPGETPETVDETVRFVKKLEGLGGFCGFHLLAPFPGTAVRDRRDEYQIRILTNDWSEYHANYAIVETPAVTAAMLDAVVDEPKQELEKQLTVAMRKIKNREPLEEGELIFENLDRILFLYELMMSNALERNGVPWNDGAPTSEAEMVRNLARRVHGFTKKTEEEASRLLSNALRDGHIRASRDRDSVHWAWTEQI